MKVIAFLIPILLLSSCNIFRSVEEKSGNEGFVYQRSFIDYSQLGDDYSDLMNLRLKVDSISYQDEVLDRFGNVSFLCARYEIAAWVRMSTSCSFFDRIDKKHKAYPRFVTFELTIPLESQSNLFSTLRDTIIENYRHLSSSGSFEYGSFDLSNISLPVFFWNGQAESITEPFILATPDYSFFLRLVDNDEFIMDNSIIWAQNFAMEEVVRGIKIITQSGQEIAPSFNQVISKDTLIQRYYDGDYNL